MRVARIVSYVYSVATTRSIVWIAWPYYTPFSIFTRQLEQNVKCELHTKFECTLHRTLTISFVSIQLYMLSVVFCGGTQTIFFFFSLFFMFHFFFFLVGRVFFSFRYSDNKTNIKKLVVSMARRARKRTNCWERQEDRKKSIQFLSKNWRNFSLDSMENFHLRLFTFSNCE